jgi:hypothetical protein
MAPVPNSEQGAAPERGPGPWKLYTTRDQDRLGRIQGIGHTRSNRVRRTSRGSMSESVEG